MEYLVSTFLKLSLCKPSVRIAVVILSLYDFPLHRPRESAPGIVIDIFKIVEPVSPAVVKSSAEAHVTCESVRHERKILPADELTYTKNIRADIRITEADIVILSPLNGLSVRRVRRHILILALPAYVRASRELVQKLNSLFPCGELLSVRVSVICVDIAVRDIACLSAIGHDVNVVIDNKTMHEIIKVFAASAVIDSVRMDIAKMRFILINTILICFY